MNFFYFYEKYMIPKVYITKEISPTSLVKIYEALNHSVKWKVAVKISTWEKWWNNFLSPNLIKDLVHHVNWTIVECNTAYGGQRYTSESHRETIKAHWFLDIANVDIMDEYWEIQIPVQDTTHIKYNIVWSHIQNYDFMINLAHFKWHIMWWFGGTLKNQSIGIASANGKANIHTAWVWEKRKGLRKHIPKNRDKNPESNYPFIESMVAAAQSIANYFWENILYINVMNNLSIDCDCESNPAKSEMKDIWILSSLDPVALDKACLDLIFNYESKPGDNATALIERINSRHWVHIVEYAEKIWLWSCNYDLISID